MRHTAEQILSHSEVKEKGKKRKEKTTNHITLSPFISMKARCQSLRLQIVTLTQIFDSWLVN